MKVMWPFRKAEELDRDVHAELQHVKVVIAQVKSLQRRYEGDNEIHGEYQDVMFSLHRIKAKLEERDVQHYEVDAG